MAAGEVDVPVVESALQLEASARDELEVFAEEAEVGGFVDRGAGLVDALLFNEDAAGEDEGLGPFAGLGVAAIDEEFV
jgi:hypothetical protein